MARSGIHTFRFDYRGTGDSFGNPEDILSIAQWTDDIRSAIEHVRGETRAANVMLIGLRLGATLAAMVARQNTDVNSLVFWEPVFCGKTYLQNIRQMHKNMIDMWVCRMETPSDHQIEEILGTQYSRSLLTEIENIQLHSDQIEQPHFIVDLPNDVHYQHDVPGLQKIQRVDDENTWNQLAFLESAWLRGQTARKICQTADDMFERLQRFGVLGNVLETSAAGSR